jgi:hypothetical protein
MTTTASPTTLTAVTLTADRGFGPVLMGVFALVDDARVALRADCRGRDRRCFGPLRWSADRLMASYDAERGFAGCCYRIERHELTT